MFQYNYSLFCFSDELPQLLLKENDDVQHESDLFLFNLGNLSSKAIINIFGKIFPQLIDSEIVKNLEIEITFFEFFEAFITCAEESIRVKDEEIRWREKFSAYNLNVLPAAPPRISRAGHLTKIK